MSDGYDDVEMTMSMNAGMALGFTYGRAYEHPRTSDKLRAEIQAMAGTWGDAASKLAVLVPNPELAASLAQAAELMHAFNAADGGDDGGVIA